MEFAAVSIIPKSVLRFSYCWCFIHRNSDHKTKHLSHFRTDEAFKLSFVTKRMATSEDAGDSTGSKQHEMVAGWDLGVKFFPSTCLVGIPRKYMKIHVVLIIYCFNPQDSKSIPGCWWAFIWLQEVFASISRAFRTPPWRLHFINALALGLPPMLCR